MPLGKFKRVKFKHTHFSNWRDPLESPAWVCPWLKRATKEPRAQGPPKLLSEAPAAGRCSLTSPLCFHGLLPPKRSLTLSLVLWAPARIASDLKSGSHWLRDVPSAQEKGSSQSPRTAAGSSHGGEGEWHPPAGDRAPKPHSQHAPWELPSREEPHSCLRSRGSPGVPYHAPKRAGTVNRACTSPAAPEGRAS